MQAAHTTILQPPLHPSISKASPHFFSQLQSFFHQIIGLVFSAAAACPVLDRRSPRAHFLQPPAQLLFTPPQRLHQFASWLPLSCSDNNQRVQLLCVCCPLSTLASRLALSVNRRDCFVPSFIPRIMQRCLGGFAYRLWKKVMWNVLRRMFRGF
jgi:hypothetical protein